jgi:hypothetical protein
VRGQIAKVEFLGGHCLAELQVPELDGQPLACSSRSTSARARHSAKARRSSWRCGPTASACSQQ